MARTVPGALSAEIPFATAVVTRACLFADSLSFALEILSFGFPWSLCRVALGRAAVPVAPAFSEW